MGGTRDGEWAKEPLALTSRKHHSTKATSAMDPTEVGCTTNPGDSKVKSDGCIDIRITQDALHAHLTVSLIPISPYLTIPGNSSPLLRTHHRPPISLPGLRSPLARLCTTSTVPRSTAAGPLRGLHRGLGALAAAGGLQLASRNRQLQL